MQSILMESAIRATLLIAAVSVVLWALRIRAAAVRHAAWASVVVAMLVLPGLVTWGPKISLAVLPEQAASIGSAPVFVETGGEAAAVSVRGSNATVEGPAIRWWWQDYALGIYLLGLGFFLMRLAVGTAHVVRLVRSAELDRGKLVHPSCSTPITVGCFRPTVILPAGWSEWPRTQLGAALAHEGAHVRRRDPLFQWLGLLNRAVFWFHPLAWWLERELSGLAEEACDDAVLAQGHDAGEYSASLVEMARRVQTSGARVMGLSMPGERLPGRVHRMMSGIRRARTPALRVAGAAVLCGLTGMVFLAGTVVRAQRPVAKETTRAVEPKKMPVVVAQARTVAPPPQVVKRAPVDPPKALEFEVAAIKPADPNSRLLRSSISAGRLTADNVTLRTLIEDAYQLPPFLLTGGPSWLDSAKFGVAAKGPETATPVEIRLMLRALLAERFQLVMHTDRVEQSTYALQVKDANRISVKLAKAQEGGRPRFGSAYGGAGSTSNRFTFNNQSMSSFATMLTRQLQRVVEDETGLVGEFDFEFESTREEGEPNPFVAPWAPSLGDIGLKLESRKGPVQIYVVDRAERPGEN